jgi:thiol-disulfide isomerase/thioredoxin
MRKYIFFLGVFILLSLYAKSQYIIVELKHKIRVKTDLDYEKVLELNPDIANFDIKAGDLVYENIKLRIGILNENRNHQYNEIDTDYLLVGDYLDASLYVIENISCVKIGKKNILQAKDKYFLITHIAEDGSKIVLQPTKNEKATIKYIDELPENIFNDFKEKSFSFENFKNKGRYIYIYFWASWCSYCIPKISYINQLQEKYSSKLDIIGFNGDIDEATFQKAIKEYKIKWRQFKPNSMLSENLKHKGYPHSILANQDGKIIKWHASIDDVINILEKNKP